MVQAPRKREEEEIRVPQLARVVQALEKSGKKKKSV